MRERKPISPLLLSIFTLFLLISPGLSATPTSSEDAVVMKKLAASLKPTPPGWTSSDPCQWTGVNCNAGRIESINLVEKSLSGTLPADLNKLSSLKKLALQRNQLSGPLPSLENLADLQEIYLDNNKFTSIPATFFSGLTSLQMVSLDGNVGLAAWEIPKDLAQSSSLATFYASNCSIMGTIPDFFGEFVNLQGLKLSYNNLSGSLPDSFGTSGIQNLWLNDQDPSAPKLSGRIDVLGSMTQLSQVWLHDNNFSGPIPDLSKCTSLFDIQLRGNYHLTGIVPPSLFDLPKLVNVSLGNNKLQGPYPSFKSGMKTDKNLGENNFCNDKPGDCDPRVMVLLSLEEGFGFPESLSDAWKGNDPCDGWSFVSCDSQKDITVLNLANQHLTGTISPDIANLTSLKSLILNNNSLTGPIPKSLTGLSKLQLLDVSNNNLTGKIPDFGGSVTLKMSGNPLLGTDIPSGRENGPGTSNGDPTSPSESAKKKSSSNLGVQVGVSIAGVVVCAVIGYLVYKKVKSGQKFKRVQSPHSGSEMIKTGSDGVNGNGVYASDKNSGSSSKRSDFHLVTAGSMAFSIHDLRQVTGNFSDDNVLGRGGFGVVYKGEFPDGTQIAVKRMESAVMSNKGMNEFQAEIAVLTKVRHRHLVALMGYCVEGNERLLVYEYMPQGTLGQHLFDWKENGSMALTWKQRLTIALDVARGVEYLHSLAQESFIHRDLKPSNVLLGDDMRAKVSDFGLVKHAPDGKYSVETRLAGTFGYLAPEYCATGRVTTKADVYSFGVILMELVTGRKALDDTQPEDRTHLVTWFRRVLINKDNIMKAIDPVLDPDEETYASICKVAELAGHCTVREPYQRPDMSHAVNTLSPLVEEWKPTNFNDDEGLGSNFHMSLPQVLQQWQANEGSSMTADMPYSQRSLGNTQSSIPSKPSRFADSFDSTDCR